jgi:hypothetical protein
MTEGQRIYEQDFWEKAFLRAVGEGDPTQAEIKSGSEAADRMLEEWRKRWSLTGPLRIGDKVQHRIWPDCAGTVKEILATGSAAVTWDSFDKVPPASIEGNHNLLLVGRGTPHEATASMEAKP